MIEIFHDAHNKSMYCRSTCMQQLKHTGFSDRRYYNSIPLISLFYIDVSSPWNP